jgi:hypothetical protein
MRISKVELTRGLGFVNAKSFYTGKADAAHNVFECSAKEEHNGVLLIWRNANSQWFAVKVPYTNIDSVLYEYESVVPQVVPKKDK